jgi:hypothetical protein
MNEPTSVGDDNVENSTVRHPTLEEAYLTS